MKLTLKQLQQAQPALKKLMNADLPIKSAFKLSRIAKAINDILEDLEQQRSKLVQKYGAPTNQGFTVKPENIPLFAKDFEELLSESVTISECSLRMNELESWDNIKLSAMDLIALESIFSNPEVTDSKKEDSQLNASNKVP